MKHHIVERYNWHMDYIDMSDCMANSYSVSRRTLQVHHEIVFPPSRSNSTQQLDTIIFMWG